MTTADHVRYNCQIEAPFREAAPTPIEEEQPQEPPAPKASCCPLPATSVPSSSELVEALPTILVGIGFAYAVGVLTGAFIFSSPVE